MASEGEKKRVATVVKLRSDIAARLDKYKSETGVSKTFAIEKAIEKYLDEIGVDKPDT